MVQICLVVTNLCNWNCDYCSMDTHNRSIEFSQVKEHLKDIPENSKVCLTGGEPGLLSSEEMEDIFTTLEAKNSVIDVTTNGMFFKKHEQFLPRVNHILYHCSEDLYDDFFKPTNTNDTIIEYMLVINDNNIVRLDEYLERHNDITFTLYKCEEVIVNGQMGPTLSKKNALEILKKHKNRITKDSVTYLLGLEENKMEIEVIGKNV